MNIVIGIAILLTLMLGDSSLAEYQSVSQALAVSAWTMALILIPPLVAAIQVLGVQKTSRARNDVIRRQVNIHAMIWLATSVTIALILQWPNVVRFDLGLDGLILIDELLILSPLLLSLICSWWIQSDYQSSASPNPCKISFRLQFVAIRCQVYLAIILLPVLLLLLFKDLWPYLSFVSPLLATTLAAFSFAAMLCLMPWFIGLMWNNRSILESEGRTELIQHCVENRLVINDIRIWDTGNQVVNALVAGIHPTFRVLMLSDLLLNSFPKHELMAVLRHEAGHVRLGHLPIRIGFILLPALALIAVEMDANQTLSTLAGTWVPALATPVAVSGLLGVVFVTYILLITAWLSRNMEFEADLFAIGAIGSSWENVDTRSAQSMADALLRFAEQNPDQYAQRSFTHPSLIERIDVIKDYIRNPKSAVQFRQRFMTIQAVIAVSIVSAAFVLILV